MLAASPADEALLDRIEARVKLPTGAAPLASYARYYARQANGEIVAIYLRLGDDAPGRRWVSERDLPLVADGGCSVVTIIVESSGTVRSATCNGEA